MLLGEKDIHLSYLVTSIWIGLARYDFYKDWPGKIDNSGTNVMGIASYFLMLCKTELMPGFLKVIKLEVS